MEEQEGTRTLWRWLALIAMVVLLASLAVWKAARASRSMSAAAENEQQFAQTAPGTKTKIVVEIKEVTREGKIQGKLLQKQSEEIYARTKTAATVRFGDATSIVMGKRSDVHAGAIVHVTGTARADGSVAASQIVILTGYVRVQ
jgi:hypothetical protein